MTDSECAAYIGQSKRGGRVGGHVRVVFGAEHTARVAAALASAGTEIFASPTRTRWTSLNARLPALAGWGEAVQQCRTAPVRSGVAWFVA